MLKDLTNNETQQKFYKTNLNEVRISFYNRQARNSQVASSARFNNIMSSIDIDGNEVPEEIDIDEDGEQQEDDNFAQSMPA